jgi:hypothetical protein
MLSPYLAHGLGKLKPKAENPGGNTRKSLGVDLGCRSSSMDNRSGTRHAAADNWKYPIIINEFISRSNSRDPKYWLLSEFGTQSKRTHKKF